MAGGYLAAVRRRTNARAFRTTDCLADLCRGRGCRFRGGSRSRATSLLAHVDAGVREEISSADSKSECVSCHRRPVARRRDGAGSANAATRRFARCGCNLAEHIIEWVCPIRPAPMMTTRICGCWVTWRGHQGFAGFLLAASFCFRVAFRVLVHWWDSRLRGSGGASGLDLGDQAIWVLCFRVAMYLSLAVSANEA